MPMPPPKHADEIVDLAEEMQFKYNAEEHCLKGAIRRGSKLFITRIPLGDFERNIITSVDELRVSIDKEARGAAN